ncbi:acyl carrier protein [Streptomyces sp. NPDC046215]|uniref:Acyl carrier protein n=1 Tax=Streptomyces stramineus TaxID=173861 RepID=A0ABN0ZBT9_9ACTN
MQDETRNTGPQLGEETYERLRHLCAEVLCVPLEDVVPGARLITDLDADSLDHAELADSLSRSFGVRVDEEELRSVETFADVVELVAARAAPPAGTGREDAG